MKQGWELKTLEDVCQFQNGFAFKSKTFKDEGVPVLRISNIQKDNIDLRRIVFVDPSDYKEDLSKYVVNKGDLLIAMSGATTGKIGFNNTDDVFYLNQRVGKFKPSEQLNIHYLYYFLSTQVEENLKISAGSAQPNLSTQQIKSFKLPFPPLEEQKQIVAKLDQCFEAIDKARANAAKNLENAKELFQSKLNEIFSQKGEGWVEVVLNEIGETQTGTTPPTKDISNYGDYIPFVKPPHFSPDGSINTGSSMLSKSGLEKGRLFQSNSVLMVCIGATIGKTGFSTVPVSSNQQINCLTPKKEYNPKLFYYGLISPFVQRQVIEIGSGSQATLPIINKSKWSKLRINIPTERSVQDVIVQLLDGLKQKTQPLESKYQQELNSLEELKKSILQKAFKGEL